MKTVFEDFKHENPDMKIGFSTFASLKPKAVQATNKQPWYSCLCDISTNVDLKLAPIFSLATRKRVDCVLSLIKDRYKAVNATLCNFYGKFAKLCCIDRTCGDCSSDHFMNKMQQSGKGLSTQKEMEKKSPE